MYLPLLLYLFCPFSSALHYYDEQRAQQQFRNALATVKQILNTTRHPEFASNVPHTYDDKYSLAEFLTSTAIAAEINSLSAIGVTQDQLKRMKKWVETNKQRASVGLRARQRCKFVRNESTQIPDGPETLVSTSELFRTSTTKHQTFKRVTTYYYVSSFFWQFVGFRGTAATRDNSFVIDERNISFEVKTTWNAPPDSCKSFSFANTDLDLTWLFQHLDNNLSPSFTIDRGAESCHTPRRNMQITEAYVFFDYLSEWTWNALSLPGLSTVPVEPVFVPVIPLFENNCAGHPATSLNTCNATLSLADLNAFLAEEQAGFQAVARQASDSFPARTNTSVKVSVVEVMLTTSLSHQQQIVASYKGGIDFIEGMLTTQLVAAIGKEVSANDFGDFIRFNSKRLFKAVFSPQDLSYSVRRPDHYPEGVVEILQTSPSVALPFPIHSFVRVDRPAVPVNSTLSGGTVISLNGPRFLHAAIFYEFGGSGQPSLQLAARARQFSSFVLLVGSMISENEFRADIGIIIKDKDDLAIPLLLETIPTPKAFRDAIESLSPEQRAFAKAFRSMQLSNTLFAFAIIQIKPQLERLLKLPEDSLTKEIQLTQDLMRLFLDYQIPSDLLSFQGANDLAPQNKIAYVKAQVAQMNIFIASEKEAQLREKQQRDAGTRVPQQIPAVRGFVSVPEPYQVRVPRAVRVPQQVPISKPKAVPVDVAQPYQVTINTPASPVSPVQSSTRSASTSNIPRNNESLREVAVVKLTDYTAIPAILDERVFKYDEDASLRATILKAGSNWLRHSQKGLLGDRTLESLDSGIQTAERQKAFDLLEALSKSGIMKFDDSEYHVVIGSTQSFDQTLLDTVIQKNENPIAQLERSEIIVATTVFDLPAIDLLAVDQIPRVAGFTPKLFPDAAPLSNH